MALTAALRESRGVEQSQGVVKLARGSGGEERRREHMFDKAAARLAGAVLRFEDGRGGGKAWAFRFSYWSSCQSYVIKGWSAFVRDSRLPPARRRRSLGARDARRASVFTSHLRNAASGDIGGLRGGRFIRLFGVDLEVAGAEPLLSTDLQLALKI
ncbi:hypothetical protein ACQ4PT_066009 [Festuca glaucescens]